MDDERRGTETRDRRAKSRGGRRSHDAKKAWYLRQKWWLAAASLAFVGWRRVRSIANKERTDTHAPA
jgi:hypothetical protein